MLDNNGNRPIIEPLPAAAAAADVKKLTMKGLKLELDDLVNFIEGDVLGQLIELANAIEAHNKALVIVSNNQEAIQQSIDLIATARTEGGALDTLTDLQADVDKLKAAQNILSSNQTLLQEGMYILSSNVMAANPPAPAPPLVTRDEPERWHPEDPVDLEGPLSPPPITPEPKPEPIPEPEPEPVAIQPQTHQHVALESIADSCIVMNDILLLCKAMKKVPELDDQTRISLLDLAGRRAGIEIQPGMQVRAGVKMIVA